MVTDLAVASVSHPSSYRNFRSPTEPTGREFRDLQIAETDALPHLREVRDLCVVRAHAKENKNKNTMMVPTPNNKTEKEKKNDPQKGATQWQQSRVTRASGQTFIQEVLINQRLHWDTLHIHHTCTNRSIRGRLHQSFHLGYCRVNAPPLFWARLPPLLGAILKSQHRVAEIGYDRSSAI